MQNLRFVCTRCGNCCTDKETLVNLTYLDILRIKNGLKLDIEETLDILGFYIFDKTISEEIENKMVMSPIETERGSAFVALRKNNLGVCYFYNSIKKKCSIYHIRPMLCRTFPFSFRLLDEKNNENKNNIQIIYTEKGKQYCPGIKNEAPLINYEEWKKLGKKTLQELKINHKVINDWNEWVKKGKSSPTAKKFLNILFDFNDF